MASLPSFVELMASLGIDNDVKPKPLPAARSPDGSISSRSRSSSTSSTMSSSHTPLATISRHPHKTRSSPSLAPQDGSLHSSRRPARFTPYPSLSRRGSVPSISFTGRENSAAQERAHSQSPSTADNIRELDESPEVLPQSLSVSSPPISSYVRRHSPGISPTSPIFPQHTNYQDPIAIPELPQLFIAPAPSGNKIRARRRRAPSIHDILLRSTPLESA